MLVHFVDCRLSKWLPRTQKGLYAKNLQVTRSRKEYPPNLVLFPARAFA